MCTFHPRKVLGLHYITSCATGNIEYSLISDKPGQQFNLHLANTRPEPQMKTLCDGRSSVSPPSDVKLVEWVAAINDAWYPGLVEVVHLNTIMVRFMENSCLPSQIAATGRV